MSFGAKLAAFWAVVFAILTALRLHPRARLSTLMLSTQGPTWQVDELKSSFHRQKTIFALGWLLQVVVADALLLTIATNRRVSTDPGSPFSVFAFMLEIATGMALLGTMLAALVWLKAATLGPNPVMPAPIASSDDDADDDPEDETGA